MSSDTTVENLADNVFDDVDGVDGGVGGAESAVSGESVDAKDSREVSNKRRRESSNQKDRDSDGDLFAELNCVKDQLKNVVCALQRVTREIEKLGGAVNSILSKLDDHDSLLKSFNDRLSTQAENISRTNKCVSAMEGDLRVMKQKVRDLEMKAIDQEARSRRNNLLFFGIPESHGEDCSSVVGDLIKSGSDFPLHRAHRIGPRRTNTAGKSNNRPIPIIAAFLDYRDREAGRAARSKLNRPLGIAEDFPLAIRKTRETLLPELREVVSCGKRATIAYPARLIVEGRVVKEASVLDNSRVVH